MEEPDSDPGSYPFPPASVHLTPFSPPSSRRLSTNFTRRRHQPLESSPPLPYISLQHLLLNSDEPISPQSISGLTRDESVAWELFTPLQRLLIVALIGVSAAESKKNGLIQQLQTSVDLRDRVLSSMQRKLDDLCQELNLAKDQPGNGGKDLDRYEDFGFEKIKFVDCGCWLCDQHYHHHTSPAAIQDKAVVIDGEREERRMSDMSDWCSSFTSSAAETHFDSLSLDQDMFSLRKECREKDETIKDLTSFLHLANKAGSKRETELEEVISRKKIIIKKLKRDVLVLEDKVMQLTRLRRSSYSPAISDTREFPMRLDNVLYDMDVSTASSSSDSEGSAKTPQRVVLEDARVDSVKEEPRALPQTRKSAPAKSSTSLMKSVKPPPPSVVSPSVNQKPLSASSSSTSKARRATSNSDTKKPRKLMQITRRDSSSSQKRWV